MGHNSMKPAAILIVDDNPANLLALAAILEPLGHEIVSAHSGAEALRCALEREFAVALMDVQMPGMDGFQTTRLIKRHPAGRHLPIIFLTAIDRDTSHIFRGYEYGAVDYLVKPFEPHILRSKVSVFIELFIQRDQLRQQAELLHAERLARAQAEAKMMAREEILAIVSHDLGNPITAASTGAALLLRRGVATGDEAVQKQSAMVQRALERMHRLVNDLLDASRIEGGRLALDQQTHEASDIVRQAIDVILPIATARTQQLTCSVPDRPISVTCDRDRIYQVLSNLLGNASKFTPEGGRISAMLVEHDGEVEFGVEDSGPGIGVEDVPHIFDRYWQAAGRKRMGLGLGLAIAKGIVLAHGGRIWVESQLGSGSTFRFTLPKVRIDAHDRGA
ncbi:MAG TPA: hybrid sensor histidine kinase/response regulator [Polyangiaceae bacterium]